MFTKLLSFLFLHVFFCMLSKWVIVFFQNRSRPSFYRAKKILALVPKPNISSDKDESSGSGEEFPPLLSRLDNHDEKDGTSSSAPSLPSSFENLHLLSDTESIDLQESISDSPVAPIPSPLTPKNTGQPTPQLISANTQNFKVPILSPSVPTTPFSRPIVSPLASTTRARRPRLLPVKLPVVKRKILNCKWVNNKFLHRAEIIDKVLPDASSVSAPFEYFKMFLSDNILDMITEQTNLYSTQETGKAMKVTTGDIKDFIGINLLMGIIKLPAYTDYWSKEFRCSLIADVMPLKKFQAIRRYVHLNNNLLDDGDRYFKIRPLIQMIRQNFLKVPHETRFSIDEMMVPYKGKKAGNRKQYVKNKPKKWGFKIFVRAGVSGFIYDFIVYGGDDTFRYNELSQDEESLGLGAKVVIALCKSIPDPACSVVYFDNFFTSLELICYLRNEMGIFSLGTIRSNRLRGAEKKLSTDKVLRKKSRGSHSQVVCNSNKLCIVKWLDNKCVTTASSFVEANPIGTIQRYDKDKKQKTAVPCPEIIKQYNAHMGGVDLADMLIALHRTQLKGHRWYLPLFSQLLDMCVTNSWVLYRRHCAGKIKALSLKKFRYSIVQGLLKCDRHVTNPSDGPTPSKIIKAPVAPRPTTDVRFDQLGHFPIFVTKGRCKLCTKGQTTIQCSKCLIRLCLLPNRNCFTVFHVQ